MDILQYSAVVRLHFGASRLYDRQLSITNLTESRFIRRENTSLSVDVCPPNAFALISSLIPIVLKMSILCSAYTTGLLTYKSAVLFDNEVIDCAICNNPGPAMTHN